jgi:hypothetical protein
MGKVWVVCKKVFSISLVFNALLTIGCLVGILSGYYWYYHDWEPFAPFLLSGELLWVTIIAAVINIFPSAKLGRHLHTGRLWFHHYLYGFFLVILAAVYVIVFTPISLVNLFFINSTSLDVNIGRFFLLGGTALLLDDLPDVSKKIESALNRLKVKAGQSWRFLSALQIVCGAISLYIFGAVVADMWYEPDWITLANVIVAGTTFITGITCFIFVKRKVWLNITSEKAQA